MRDFHHLVAVAKKYHIGILLDLVLNHTSIDHLWFRRSELHDTWYKDYYVWLDKPLNWKSFFGGPAFDYSALRGKYYLHLYDRAQPDLNFNNTRVIKEFKEIIAFCKDRGVQVEAFATFGTTKKNPVAANDLLGNKTIVDISKKYGKTPSQIILSWVLGQGASVVPKARSRQHLSENIDVFDFELSSEEMQSIDRLNTGNSHRYFR
jgi:hypothetical protein